MIKPVLIALLVILTVLIIIKANRIAVGDQAPDRDTGRHANNDSTRKTPRRVQNPSQSSEFIIVYLGRRVPVTHYPFTIGSRSDNDLVISDSTVSRKHAELFLKNGRVCLRDLGSLNGTLVNRVSRSEVPLVGGEKVQFGTTVVQIEKAEQEVSDDTQFIRR